MVYCFYRGLYCDFFLSFGGRNIVGEGRIKKSLLYFLAVLILKNNEWAIYELWCFYYGCVSWWTLIPNCTESGQKGFKMSSREWMHRVFLKTGLFVRALAFSAQVNSVSGHRKQIFESSFQGEELQKLSFQRLHLEDVCSITTEWTFARFSNDTDRPNMRWWKRDKNVCFWCFANKLSR